MSDREDTEGPPPRETAPGLLEPGLWVGDAGAGPRLGRALSGVSCPCPFPLLMSVEQRGLCRCGGFPRRPSLGPGEQGGGGRLAKLSQGWPSCHPLGPPCWLPAHPFPSVDKKPYILESRVHGVSFPTHSLGRSGSPHHPRRAPSSPRGPPGPRAAPLSSRVPYPGRWPC